MADPDTGEPVARSPLPGLPPLDPLPWTGTAAPGNTGRPYGERHEAAAAWDAGARQAVVNGQPVPIPDLRGPIRSAPGADRTDRTGRPDRAAGPGRPAAPRSRAPRPATAGSARRSGHRAMRAGVAGTGLAVLGFVLSAVAPAAAAVAFLLAVGAAFVAFGSGVRGLRDARRTRVGSGPAAIGTVLGAAGLVVVLAIVVSALSFRSEIARAVTCAENASGSQQQTKVCTQQFKDSVQNRINGG